ncbi:hypothetical protein QOZ80_2AG0102560 [Eleusine coracana subsp. coracana]|nr:hypothetical protein QOZ80_2AG0102560 [Eleusine coracana subsp. coracana]
MNMAPAVAMIKQEASFGEAGEDSSRKRKKAMGRQKIEIKRIDKEEKRQVCFSKRKDGLFKKASDLAVLCGGHVAAVAFSPGGKPFSFGHPSVQAVVDRFVGPFAPAMGRAPVSPALLDEVHREEDLLAKALDAEAGWKKALESAMGQAGVWTGGMDGKSAPDFLALHSALEKVQADVAERLHQEFMANEMMTQYTATGTDVSGVFHYPGAGTFMADDGGVNSHDHHQTVIDTQMMMTMGGNVDHNALPFTPMMLPLSPYNHCFDLNHGPGFGHGPVFGVEGLYGAMAHSLFE